MASCLKTIPVGFGIIPTFRVKQGIYDSYVSFIVARLPYEFHNIGITVISVVGIRYIMLIKIRRTEYGARHDSACIEAPSLSHACVKFVRTGSGRVVTDCYGQPEIAHDNIIEWDCDVWYAGGMAYRILSVSCQRGGLGRYRYDAVKVTFISTSADECRQ